MCDIASLHNWDSYKNPFPTAAYEMYNAQSGVSNFGPTSDTDGFDADDD
jgi:hypothetical protein